MQVEAAKLTETQPTNSQTDNQGPKTGWVIAIVVLIAVALVVILALTGVFSPQPEAGTSTPPTTGPFITISEPQEGAVVDISQPITVRGQAGALFEGGLVVEVRDASDNVLAQKPTIVQSPEAGTGGQGPWEVQLPVSAAPGTPGQIVAYATSPKDGSLAAEARVSVSLGSPPEGDAFILIDTPVDGTELDANTPISVQGTAGGLFEGSLVVQALDVEGAVIAQEITTVQAADAGSGGEGPWSVELNVNLQADSPGKITAFSVGPDGGTVMASASVEVNFVYPDLPEEAVKIEDHLWLLASLKQAPVLPGSRIYMQFANQRVSGSAGCNDYDGPYQLTMDTLDVGDLATTRKTCELPQGVMEQEAVYISALQSSAAYLVQDGQLVIENADGVEVLRYNAAVVGELTAEQAELPADAVITIQIQDTSLADAPAQVIGEQNPENPGAFPVPFAVTYDPEAIQPQNQYTLSARVAGADGALLFTNTEVVPVITRGAGSNMLLPVAPVQ
jgi:uncharacterized lipoprotein YbaY